MHYTENDMTNPEGKQSLFNLKPNSDTAKSAATGPDCEPLWPKQNNSKAQMDDISNRRKQ